MHCVEIGEKNVPMQKKNLGVMWNRETDKFSFWENQRVVSCAGKVTFEGTNWFFRYKIYCSQGM